MNTVRRATLLCPDRLGAVSAVLGLVLLAACGSPRVALATEEASVLPIQRIDGICAKELSYDVTGPYFQSCRNYLRRHVHAQPVAIHLDEPAEHRACEEIGLARDTLDYRKCVQELYQLDVSNDHL
ncbi:MAG TPA: hypothetical protein VH722_10935 [Alphaproteobacteria bacterium]|jgi:hypothetical protein|nr:hypothetical protein [Alphaproteobacteria bacterium]